MNNYKLLTFLLLTPFFAFTQSSEKSVDLNEVLNLAHEKSLDAFRAKNMFLSGYWEYQSFKAQQLPKINLRLDPATYNRMMTKRYDFENNLDVYREQQTLTSYSNLSISQNIALTGGRIYFDSDFSRLVNYGENKFTTYSVTPIRIGLVQPLFGYNSLKWQKKISPLKFDKAKQIYIQSVQETNLKVVNLYFNLILASKRREIAMQNVETADTLLRVGLKRYKIASIQREELLDLELSKFNSEIDFAQAEKEQEKSRFSLNSFLGFDETVVLIPQLPPILSQLQIDVSEAIVHAKKYNPEIFMLKQKELEANRNLDKTVKENRFSANVMASYGLNQQSDQLSNSYKDPLDQQMLMLSLDIPLVDWGDREGRKQMAKKNKEVVDIEVQQALTDFQQKIALKVIDLNLQGKLVESSAKADAIAQNSYELTKQRFMLGKADVLKLNSSMRARQLASEKYIISLYTFWRFFYEVQQITLFDLRDKVPLVEDFEKMID